MPPAQADGGAKTGSANRKLTGFALPPSHITGKVRAKSSTGQATAAGRNRGKRLNQKLRQLVQQLGEAIHESVSESEQIAGVVQDIRKHGFDVLLMLEATIGLNEVEEQPGALPAGESSEGGASFTAQDVNFLRSLRIAIEGDAGEAQDEKETPG